MNQANIDESLRLIGATRNTPWEEIKSLYRAKALTAHPDTSRDATDDGFIVSLNAAYATLVGATDNGRNNLPDIKQKIEEEKSSSVVRFAEISDPFTAILNTCHEIGDVIYVSEAEGLIQVLVDSGKPTESVLLVQIEQTATPIQILFTLELHSGHIPLNIIDVVKEFGDLEPVERPV